LLASTFNFKNKIRLKSKKRWPIESTTSPYLRRINKNKMRKKTKKRNPKQLQSKLQHKEELKRKDQLKKVPFIFAYF